MKVKLIASCEFPKQIVMGNGPQFISEEWSTFAKANGVKHIRSTPYHPSVNGAVEKLVQTFKDFSSQLIVMQPEFTVNSDAAR